MVDYLIYLVFLITGIVVACPRAVGRWLADMAYGYADACEEIEKAREARRWESQP